MCAWGSSFQWFMGIIGGSTRAIGLISGSDGRLLGASCGIFEETKWVGAY